MTSQGQSILAFLFHHRRGRLRPPHHHRAPEVEAAAGLLDREARWSGCTVLKPREGLPGVHGVDMDLGL